MGGGAVRIITVLGTVVVATLTGCAAAGSNGDAPASDLGAPDTAPEPTGRLATMVVMRDGAGLERGDTVRVNLARISEGRRVPRVDSNGEVGRVPLKILGPTGVDTMVVTANRVDVHRCRSRGCTVLGYVTRGQLIQVHDFVGAWFRFTGPDDTRGYVRSDHLELLLLHRLRRLDELRSLTAAYYRQRLQELESDGGQPLFNGHRVDLERGIPSFEFFVSVGQARSVERTCNAMRGIARFVEGRMAAIPPGVFDAYSAGVYAGGPDQRGEMIAGLSSGGGVYCDTSG